MTQKIILITGCSTGIGRAMAEDCRARGHTVYATARRLESMADLAGQGIRPLRMNVNNIDEVAAVARQISEEAGGIDIVINNAGYGAMGPLAELPLAELRQQFETNVFAPITVIQAALPEMIRRGGGCIVNVGSISGILTTPFAGAYCATKAALHNLSDALRMELAPFNIKVVIVQPGAIRSNFGANALAAVEGVLPASSRYSAVADKIRARANASQMRSTAAPVFAKRVLDKILVANPPTVVRAGLGSHSGPVLKWLIPSRLLDRLLMRQFGLDKL